MTLKNETQLDIAKLINVSLQAINKKINGKSPFKDTEMKTIADHFGTTIDNLFFNDDVDKLYTRIS